MALNLYRRHSSHCPVGRPLHEITYEADELRRRLKKCECPIYASGTLSRQFKRKNTERIHWADAKVIVAEWESAGSWNGALKPVTQPPTGPVSDASPTRISITEALQAYLAVREGAGIAAATLRKYRTFTKQLLAFADARGYVMLNQFTAGDIDVFYASWKLGARAKAKALGTLRSFFRFCMNREWLVKNPVTSDLKPPLGANRAANKNPFTDDEIQRILHACDRLKSLTWSNGFRKRSIWTGEDTKDFIWMLVYTGLRISDVGLFHMSRLRGNEVFLRAKKNGGDVFTWIPNWLRDRLQERAKRHGERPFAVGASDRLETVTDLWRRKINQVFEFTGKFEETPTPHRFRHTFARILLQRGVPVADVADLLGDDEDTVREHYSRWVPERQARLTNILQDAFTDKPKPKLVALPRRSS